MNLRTRGGTLWTIQVFTGPLTKAKCTVWALVLKLATLW